MRIVSTEDFDRLELFKEHVRTNTRPWLKAQYGETYSKYIAPLLDDMLEDLEEFVETVGEESIHDEDLAFDNEEEE